MIERLVSQSVEHLKPGGWLILEISPMICQEVERLIRYQPELEITAIVKDFAGHFRVVQARMKK